MDGQFSRTFAYCCGCAEIGFVEDKVIDELYNRQYDAQGNPLLPDKIKKLKMSLAAKYVKYIKGEIRPLSEKFVIATSIPSQKDWIKGLQKCKFTEIKTFKNPNSGHKVTVWGLLRGKTNRGGY